MVINEFQIYLVSDMCGDTMFWLQAIARMVVRRGRWVAAPIQKSALPSAAQMQCHGCIV